MEIKNVGNTVKTPDVIVIKNKEKKCIVVDTENAQDRIPVSVNLADFHAKFYTNEEVKLPQFVIDFLSRKTTNRKVDDGVPNQYGEVQSRYTNVPQYIVRVLE